MIKRHLLSTVLADLKQFPAVAILGPRRVGKTTLAKSIAKQRDSIYLDLETRKGRDLLTDPEWYLSKHEDKLVILDEIQFVPELFQEMRGLIDRGEENGRRAGRFLILGSASIDLLKQSSETLAGRISHVELSPLDVSEIGGEDHDRLWIQGGFPDSFLAESEDGSTNWRANFIKTYLERDIPLLGPRIPATTLQRFWTMLAHTQGQLLNASNLARSLAVDGKTVAGYLDLMVDLLLVRRLPPWHSNTGKRLVKSPRTYIRDSGLLHTLLGLETQEDVISHPVAGSSWEGFVIENLLRTAHPRTRASFYRTAAGAEIDLLLEIPRQGLWAIETKQGLRSKLERGFHQAREDLAPNRCFVVYSGTERYSPREGIEVISLPELCQELRPAQPAGETIPPRAVAL